MPWVPQDRDGEQLRGPKGGPVPAPQRIQCDECHFMTKKEWWNAKEARPTGVYFPDYEISWCPRCAVADQVYGARVEQSMNACDLPSVEELMTTHWASAAPPPVSATQYHAPATAIVPTQVVAEQEPSLPAPLEPPTELDMIRVLQDEIAALKSRIEQLEHDRATPSTFLPILDNLAQRIEELEIARASSAPAERRGRRAT